MKALIHTLAEASGPERLTVTPHTCPHGWEQVKVRKAGRIRWTCKPPSAMDLARRGAEPLSLAWQAVKAGKWDRALESLGLAMNKLRGRERSMLSDIVGLVEGEVDGDGLGKRAVINHTKPLFKKLGVDVTASRSKKRSR